MRKTHPAKLELTREQVKQVITEAILSGDTEKAKEILHEAKEYETMTGRFVFSSVTLRDLKQAIDEAEIEASKDELYGNHFKSAGAKYKELGISDTREIVKLIRSNIKKKYPAKSGWKFSITKPDYNYIQVTFKSSPIKCHSHAFQEWAAKPLAERDSYFDTPNRYTDDFEKVYDDVKSIIDSYNFDDSDSMTDYFHVNFYSNIGVDIPKDQ